MASITLLSLAPAATFLHLPACTTSFSPFAAIPRSLTGRRALPLRARAPRRVTVVCSVRRGFEGGQMPLYRRLPKLRGIAGGMHIGLPKYVPFNLRDIAQGGFKDGEEISLESLKSKGLINPSGRERKLPLKILGDGDVSVKLTIKAGAFSSSAKEKLEAAGCTLTVLPKRKKWLPAAYVKNQARAEEYFKKKNGGAGESDAASA
uniref:Uncharacterized protein n=1 Tax=Avena sativa TaxID=4498 RepID=A0ACD5TVX8_AVESA